jgi:DNA mismatch repair protein MutL
LIDSGSELKHWKDFFEGPGTDEKEMPAAGSPTMFASSSASMEIDFSKLVQIADTYIMVPLSSGFMLVHQQNAHERILYESFSGAAAGKTIASQRLLFPVNFELGAADAVLFAELIPELKPLGFDIESFGKNAFVIHGTPAGFTEGIEKMVLENMLEQYKHYSAELKVSANEKIWRSLAAQQSIKPGRKLEAGEMEEIVLGLQAIGFPSATATGRPVYIKYERKELDRLFGR